MSSPKDKRYFFDLNNFDAPEQPEEDENLPPPPPMFTLDELGFAKDDAFERGRQQGFQEAAQTREHYLSGLLDKVSQELKFLTGAEQYRAAIYEREVLSLTETCLRTIFPYLTETAGLDEIKSVISQVLANQSEQPKIQIEVPEGDADAVENFLKSRFDLDMSKLAIKGNPDLKPASCKLSWKDGTALRDHDMLAKSILKMLKPSVSAAQTVTEAPPLAPDVKKDENEDLHELGRELPGDEEHG